MSAPVSTSAARAVFLSYASQDADAAKKICDALRAAGVEVWFDQSELRGGDSWDQKIRRQIKECALFMPIVSANTQARREGYFRLEWKLADDRTHLMAKGTPFLVPVCIDDTKDWDALVPDSFMTVQWTRLTGGETTEKFCTRVVHLLEGGSIPPMATRPPMSMAPPVSEPVQSPRKKENPAWLTALIVVVPVVVGLVLAWRVLPHGGETSAPKLPATRPPAVAITPPAPAPSEGLKLATQARALYDKSGFGRDDVTLADELAKRATDLEPASAFAWGVRAHVQAAFLFRGFAVGDEFVRRAKDAQSFANRALALQADEGEALLALGRVATYQRAYAQAEEIFNRALGAHPDDTRLRRALGTMLRYQDKRVPEALGVLQEAVRRAPRDPLTHYDLAMGYRDAWDFPNSWVECDAALALQPGFGSALLQKAFLAIEWKGDLATMRALLDQLSVRDRAEDRAVYYAMWNGAMERDPARVTAAAALTPRDFLEDSAFAGPKAWFPAIALAQAGKENLARNAWQQAEAVLRERQQADPKNQPLHVQLAETLARLGQNEEAARVIAPIEAIWREQMSPSRAERLARYYAALGDAPKAVAYLREAVNRLNQFTQHELKFDPTWDKIRASAEFGALLANPPPPPAVVQPAPYTSAARLASDTPAMRDAEQLAARAIKTVNGVNYTREALALVDEQLQRASDAAPESARLWASRALVSAIYLIRGWDVSAKRRQEAQTFANRALALDPDEATAITALGEVFTNSGAYAQAEAMLRRAIELRPADVLPRLMLATAFTNAGRRDEALAVRQEAARLFPDAPLAHYDLGMSYTGTNDYEKALGNFEAALAIESFPSAIIWRARILAGARGDFAGARAALDALPIADRSEDRAVAVSLWIGLLAHDPAQAIAAGGLTTKTYLDDSFFRGPKAMLVALAYQLDHKDALARQQWLAAEAVLRPRVQAAPDGVNDVARLAITLAWLGRTDEAAQAVANLEAAVREQQSTGGSLVLAEFYAALGDAGKAVAHLRKAINSRDTLTDNTLAADPWFEKLHGQPEFETLLAEAKARIAQKKK